MKVKQQVLGWKKEGCPCFPGSFPSFHVESTPGIRFRVRIQVADEAEDFGGHQATGGGVAKDFW